LNRFDDDAQKEGWNFVCSHESPFSEAVAVLNSDEVVAEVRLLLLSFDSQRSLKPFRRLNVSDS